MLRRLLIASVLALCSSCYLQHERSASASDDAATPIDAAPAPDASDCTLGEPSTVTFSPPFAGPVGGIRVVLLGIDRDPTINGLRMHLDTCGGVPPCVVDMIVSHVGNPLADVQVPPGSAGGTLTITNEATLVHLVDERACATCGGELMVLAGTLTSRLAPDLEITADRVVCSEGCAERRATAIARNGTTIVVSQGLPVIAAPLIATIASDYFVPCSRCDCALPDRPATGVVAAYDGFFARTP